MKTNLLKHTECNISSLEDIINACNDESDWESDRQRLSWISEAAAHLWLNNTVALRDSKEALEEQKTNLSEAWVIINTLNMHGLDNGESWPRALFWLDRNKDHKPKTRAPLK